MFVEQIFESAMPDATPRPALAARVARVLGEDAREELGVREGFDVDLHEMDLSQYGKEPLGISSHWAWVDLRSSYSAIQRCTKGCSFCEFKGRWYLLIVVNPDRKMRSQSPSTRQV